MRTYFKTLARMLKKHLARLLSIVLMSLVSISFVSGLGSSRDKIEKSIAEYYSARNVSDLIIKSKSPSGFSDGDIAAVKEIFDGDDIDTGVSFDLRVGDASEKRSLRLYFLDLDSQRVNIPELVDGSVSIDKTQVYAEASDKVIKGYRVGDESVIDFGKILVELSEQNGAPISPVVSAVTADIKPISVTVCGIVQGPLTFASDGEPSYNNPPDALSDLSSGTQDADVLENILYISKDIIPTYGDIIPSIADAADKPIIPDNDIYIALADRNKFGALSSAYKSYIGELKDKISQALSDAYIITLFDNYSFSSVLSYAEKVEMISYIVMVAFILVSVLVVFSTMTRLLDEERAQIACLKTLGYSSFAILSKYLLFALIATGIGGAGAYFVGMGITRLIYSVFTYNYVMPPISSGAVMIFYIIASTVMIAGALSATAVTGGRMLRNQPADLLRPKSPRSGERVILERMPRLWKKLSFKLKSTFRNVLRYKSRFFMTLAAVAFSTALVLTGFALLDLCLFGDFGSAAIMGIAVVIVAFAGLLTAVIIYTLTNINVSERNREIATLMVLGYHDKEVTGYIYREIYINTVIGIVFGYPVSLFLISLVFDTIGFGTIGGVSWFWWVVTPFIVLAFTWLVTIALKRKIVGLDMNASLKALE